MKVYSSGTYKIITAFALLIILTSLYFIFTLGVKLGVDFKGGSLITMDSTQDIPKEEIISFLEQNGYEKVSVNKFETPIGYRYEIELPNPDYLFQAENLRQKFEKNFKEYTLASQRGELDKQESYLNELIQQTQQIKDLANRLGVEEDIEISNNINDLNSAFYRYLSLIQKEHENRIRNLLRNEIKTDSFSLQIVSPLLSSSFTSKAIEVSLYSAFLVMIFVFYTFRKIVPSIAVLVGALSDLIVALGGMAFFGIPLNLATFSTMLMIVGYSLDTDTMLTIRAAKRKDKSLTERIEDAFRTGTNMTSTAIIAFSVVFLLSIFFGISLYYEIASVALIGLVGDLFATWGVNAVMLLKLLKK